MDIDKTEETAEQPEKAPASKPEEAQAAPQAGMGLALG
jgi:hypothetical protein